MSKVRFSRYGLRVLRGRLSGAVRVVLGKSASIPKGFHDTAMGAFTVDDYYGGCLLGFGAGDLYWFVDRYDGWGGGPGQELAEEKLKDGGVP